MFGRTKQGPEDKPKTVKKHKAPNWVTENLERWRWQILLITLLGTILFSVHGTLLFHTQKIDLFFWADIILGAFCFIAAEVQMYALYSEKKILELQAWAKLTKDLENNYSSTFHYAQTLESLKLFHATYRDSFWIEHTPPFALLIYVGYAIALPTIILKIDPGLWLNQFIIGSLAILLLLFNVKFVNDLYNLIMGYKKMKSLAKKV